MVILATGAIVTALLGLLTVFFFYKRTSSTRNTSKPQLEQATNKKCENSSTVKQDAVKSNNTAATVEEKWSSSENDDESFSDPVKELDLVNDVNSDESMNGKEKKVNNLRNPEFPYLSVSDDSDLKNPKTLQINAREPFPLENDLCVGTGLVIARTDPLDPFYAGYLGGKERMFEIRVSIRFKSKPEGIIFMGGEVPQRMKLGIVTRNAAKALLAFITRMATGLVHASFGNVDGNSGQLIDTPHIALPIWQFATLMVVTPPGEAPPPITETLDEPEPTRKARLKSKVAPFPMDTEHTYTFSFHTKYIDVINWKVRGMGIGKLSLSTFWDNMPMRLVVYDIKRDPNDPESGNANQLHLNSKKRVYLGVSINNTVHRRINQNEPLVVFPKQPNRIVQPQEKQKRRETSSSCESTTASGGAPLGIQKKRSEGKIDQVVSDSDGPSDSSLGRTDSQVYSRDSSGNLESIIGGAMAKVPNILLGNFTCAPKDALLVKLHVAAYITYYEPISRKNLTSFAVIVENSVSNKEWLVVRDTSDFSMPEPKSHKTNVKNVLRRKTSLALPKNKRAWPKRKPSTKSFAELESRRLAFDNALEQNGRERKFPKTFVMQHKPVDLMLLKHVSRKNFGIRNVAGNESMPSSRHSSMDVSEQSSRPSVTGMTAVIRRHRGSVTNRQLAEELINLESVVLRARWETYWLEEWATLVYPQTGTNNDSASSTGPQVLFYAGNTRKPVLSIELRTVTRIAPVQTSAKKPAVRVGLVSLLPALELETFGKVHTLCFRDEELRAEWLEALNRAKQSCVGHGTVSNTELSLGSAISGLDADYVVDMGDDDQAKQTSGAMGQLWDFEEDGVGNAASQNPAQETALFDLAPCRRWDGTKRVVLNNKRLVFDNRVSVSEDICKLGERVLALALELNDTSTQQDMSKFFDAASGLKLADLSTLGVDQSRIASFFLNLYHIILLHARLLVGQPSSLWGWASFGSQMCYQVGPSHVFSLAEIEHCIVRYSMVNAKILNLVQVTHRQSPYTRGLGLSVKGKGLTFAVNHFTQSELDCVPIYREETVWSQIDEYAIQLLEERVVVDERKGTVTLPKICQWYKHELGGDLKDFMNTLFPLTRGMLRAQLLRISQLGNGKVKFAKNDWYPVEGVHELK